MNRKQEVEAVRELGEQIGYGNMMHIASALWTISLEEKYGIDNGAFVPTIVEFIKEEEQDRVQETLEDTKRSILQIRGRS